MRRMLAFGMAVITAAIVLPMLNHPVLAHHSTAAYQTSVVVQKGTVTDYIWRNPHVLVDWTVKDDSGKVVQWQGEMASITSVIADGLTKDSLKPGQDVIMTVLPAKSGEPRAIIAAIKLADGTTVLKWSRQAQGQLRAGKENQPQQ